LASCTTVGAQKRVFNHAPVKSGSGLCRFSRDPSFATTAELNGNIGSGEGRIASWYLIERREHRVSSLS
jgi:hypothetical protein